MTLDLLGSTVAIAVVVLGVGAWGLWLSRASARLGPEWALGQLHRFRPVPWVLGVAGVAAAAVLEPIWLGVAVLYVAAVTGWLTRSVRKRLEAVRQTYGGFDVPA